MGGPDEVEEIFDAISYCKGASIIRMLHDWIGDKVSILMLYCVMVSILMLYWMKLQVYTCVQPLIREVS